MSPISNAELSLSLIFGKQLTFSYERKLFMLEEKRLIFLNTLWKLPPTRLVFGCDVSALRSP